MPRSSQELLRVLAVTGTRQPFAVTVHNWPPDWSWPHADCERILVVLSAGRNPAPALRVALAALSREALCVSVAVVGPSYTPDWLCVDTSVSFRIEEIREETFRLAAEHVPDHVAFRLIDTPGWHGVRTDLRKYPQDLVICSVSRWSVLAVPSLTMSDAPVMVLRDPHP